MSNDYSQVLARLATFRGHPSADPLPMAHQGLYHTGGLADTVKCFECGVELSNYRNNSELLGRHRNASPQCSQVKQWLAVGDTQRGDGQKHRNPPRPNNDVTNRGGANGDGVRGDCDASSRARLRGGSSQSTGHTQNISPNERLLQSLISLEANLNSFFREYSSYEGRLSSFRSKTWPSSCPVSAHDLSVAGLFYTGQMDKVQCSYCRGKLYNWAVDDHPMEEHAKHFPQCAFILAAKSSGLIGSTHAVNATTNTSTNAWYHDLPAVMVLRGKYTDEDLQKAVHYITNTMQMSRDDVQQELLIGVIEVRKNAPSLNTSTEQIRATLNTQGSLRGGRNGENQTHSTITSPSLSLNTPSNCHQHSSGSSSPPVSGGAGPVLFNSDIQYRLTQALRENRKLTSQDVCQICHQNRANVLYLPCRHLVSCDACVPERGQQVVCVLCNNSVAGSVKVYRS